MKTRLTVAAALLATAGPLAAQNSLQPLSFMSGCWTAPYRAGTVEQHFTTPSANVMLGTTRFMSGGRTSQFEFIQVEVDSAGVRLLQLTPGGRAPLEFRLTSQSGDSVVFETNGHQRLVYRLTAEGLAFASDNGPGSERTGWTMRPSVCAPQPQLAGQPGTPMQMGPDRTGRVMLYVTQTLNGLYLGAAVPAAFGSEDPAAYGVGLIVGPALGIGFSKLLNDARPVSLGQATAITWGGWWGLFNGLAITALDFNADEKDFFRNSAIGLVGGTVIGTVVASKPIQAGDASLVAHASAWGVWYGAVAATLAAGSSEDDWKYVLAGGNAGLVAGLLATKSVNMTAGRVWVITASGIVGGVAGLGLDLVTQPDDDKVAITVPALTSLAGLAIGTALTRNFDRGRLGMGDAPTGALLAVRDGRMRFGVPQPVPTLLPREGTDGRRHMTPGLRFTLLDLRH